MSDERLAEAAPQFMARVHARKQVDASWGTSRQRVMPDPVSRHSAGALEIGFAMPEHYNASRILYDNLQRNAESVAVICGEARFTYREMCALADRAGCGLARFGLERGGRVLMLLDDGPEYVAAIFGAMRAGFVPVLVNTLSPAELVGYYLRDSGAEAALIDARFAAVLSHEDVASSRLRHVVHVGGLPDRASPELAAHHAWPTWIDEADTSLEPVDSHRDEMAFWMYSSGSTGRPKGVVHLHHDALYTYHAYARHVLEITPEDVVFSPPKIFFAYGFGNSITFPFCAGASVVLMCGRADPASVFDVIERYRPTLFFGLPTLYTAMIAHPGSQARDLSSLRLCLSAAETLSSELFDEWQRRYGGAIVEGLGSTEVLHIYLSNTARMQKPGASGRRVPGYELKLTDAVGRVVSPGESGVLSVRGDSQAPGYWQRPDKTADTMRDGWIYTGDRFRLDHEGFYFFEGRVDDLVKVSGQWVHPVEVERCLAEHPQVRECAVLALDDDRQLKTLVAFVVLHLRCLDEAETTRELQQFAKIRLVPYKYPRVVRYLDELPKTGTGKIDRQALRTCAWP